MEKEREQQANELYEKGDWQGFLAFLGGEDTEGFSDELCFKWANAQHQLREYEKSITVFRMIAMNHSPNTELGSSARRMQAHGLLQRDGDITKADQLMQEIPESLSRDNLRIDIFLKAAYAGIEIMPEEIVMMVNSAMASIPYKTVNGHVINNAAFAIHIAREQERVKPYLSILPGLIEIAIGIYAETNTAKNHLAGACGRGSLVFEAAGESYWEGAEELANDAWATWKVFDTEQGGKYQKKVEEALAQWEKMRGLLEKKSVRIRPNQLK